MRVQVKQVGLYCGAQKMHTLQPHPFSDGRFYVFAPQSSGVMLANTLERCTLIPLTHVAKASKTKVRCTV